MFKMCPEISIIVPVFNVEKYLGNCIDSIISQTFCGWELILVDDGSYDNSWKICDDYQKKDDRIRAFHKKNGGVSSARNYGLDKASGNWILFIDSDDFVSETYLEGMLFPTKRDLCLDFVQGGCINYAGESSVGINQKYADFVGTDAAFLFDNFRGLTFSKLFKLDIIRKNQIVFDEQMVIAEDMAFTLDYIMNVKKYTFVSECGYFYRIDNLSSATKKKRVCIYEKDLISFKHLYKSTLDYINYFNLSEGQYELRMKQRASQLLSTCISLYMDISIKNKISRLKNDYPNETWKILKYHEKGFANTVLSRILYRKRFRLFGFLMWLLKIRNAVFHK